MLFNSLLFLFFFLIVTSAYYLLPYKLRWIWLLSASCYFYMCFKPVYVLIIFFTIGVDYVAGILIENAQGKRRKLWLLLSLITNIGVLVFYKYFNFLAENINLLTGIWHGPEIPLLNIVLPLGLSFHTFQAMSYTIEVYRGNYKAERHLGIYALYVMFYPQMVAGPIERPQHILPQLHKKQTFNTGNLITGIFLMSIGLFKKVVIADHLGLLIDPLYAHLHSHTSLDMIVGAFFFSVQIYCDFSGYSDIALGAALTLGIQLMRNFNYPLTSTSVTEFWRRWHISLSSWFRDYLYIPLGGNKVAVPYRYLNLLIVFLISGLWHGAGWTFVLWGLTQALAICYELSTQRFRNTMSQKLPSWLYLKLSVGLTFLYLFFTWIFFRAHSVNDAFFVISSILRPKDLHYSATALMSVKEIYYCIVLIVILIMAEKHVYKLTEASNRKKTIAIVVLLFLCYFLGVFNQAQFIYFQF